MYSALVGPEQSVCFVTHGLFFLLYAVVFYPLQQSVIVHFAGSNSFVAKTGKGSR